MTQLQEQDDKESTIPVATASSIPATFASRSFNDIKEAWRKLSHASSAPHSHDFTKPPYEPAESISEDDSEEEQPVDEDLKRLRLKDLKLYVLGCLAIAGIAVSSALLNYYAKNTSTTYFHAPLWLIWFRSNWRIAAYPIYLFLRWIYQLLFGRWVKTYPIRHLARDGTKIYGDRRISPKVFFVDIGALSSISIAVQYLTFAPFHFVSAGNATALNASNVAWVYILSVIVLGVDIMPVKILAVLCSLVGVVLLAYHEGFSNPDWESAVMMICGAMATAVYQVLYKKRIGATTDLGRISFSVSAIATFTLFTMWPIVLILYLTKAERWQWESIPWDIVCKNSSASFAFNWLVNLGVAWTNPVFTSLGFLLAVPLAHFFDYDLVNKDFLPVEIIGTVMIACGFLVLVFADRVSFGFIKNLRQTAPEKFQSLWSRIKSLVPAKGEVAISEPASQNPGHVTIAIQEHKD
ncbi:hypothetical protein RvY_14607 [Ramazzottius varieornatus]|uniref:EamA domain-containing protein n=1 Tax=Ramazzottius varieornatus TaxID=947166 RepID=A0A1D1VRX6_RAMVA|nr:hypothetical protein RvY_14607 [Ramazzottius varieornatus]